MGGDPFKRTDGNTKGANKCRRKTFLRLDLAVLVELFLLDFPQIKVERGYDENSADEDAEVGKSLLAEGEAMYLNEDNGKGLEPDVEEAVDESDVQVQQEDHGFGEVQGERADEGHESNLCNSVSMHFCGRRWTKSGFISESTYLFASHVFSHKLRLASQFLVSSQLPQSYCPAIQNVGRAGFGKHEEDEDQAET